MRLINGVFDLKTLDFVNQVKDYTRYLHDRRFAFIIHYIGSACNENQIKIKIKIGKESIQVLLYLYGYGGNNFAS